MKKIIVFILLFTSICSAQTAGEIPKTLTLNDAVVIAVQRNLNIVQAANNVDAARSSKLAGYGSFLPSLTASAGWGRTQTEAPFDSSLSTSYNAGLSLNYTIFDGLSREMNFSKSISNKAIADQNYLRTKQGIVYTGTGELSDCIAQ